MIFLYGAVALIFLEIAIFVMVGDAIGFLAALALFFGAGILGVALVQHQGLGLLARLKLALDRGLMPVDEMFDGACLMAAGILLFVPGFLSDILAFALLAPFIRKYMKDFLTRRYGIDGTVVHPDTGVIEGEFIRVREDAAPLNPPRTGL